MTLNKKTKIYFWGSVVMLTIFSMTFLIMPFTNKIDGTEQRILLIVIGLIFWFSLIAGYTFLILAKRAGRRFIDENYQYYMYYEFNEKKNKKWFQKLRVYANVPTAVADTLLIASVILMVILIFYGKTAGYVVYVDLFIIFLSFNMHLLFSGDLYKEIIYVKKRK